MWDLQGTRPSQTGKDYDRRVFRCFPALMYTVREARRTGKSSGKGESFVTESWNRPRGSEAMPRGRCVTQVGFANSLLTVA